MGSRMATQSNKKMVDKLVEHDPFIITEAVEGAFRAVDRGMYFDLEEGEATDPYANDPWRRGNLHLSAPCIYARAVEALQLKPGLSFLNLGSGTGYLSTIVGLLVGPDGTNHGIELHPDVVKYAYDRLDKFKRESCAMDKFDFVEPIFIQGNCLNLNPDFKYDRVYLGAACLPDKELFMKKLVKPKGGILVMPFENQLMRYIRLGESEWKSEKLMTVNFTLMIRGIEESEPVITMPRSQVRSLKEICRIKIRHGIRDKVNFVQPSLRNSDNIRSRRSRKEELQRRKCRIRNRKMLEALLSAPTSSTGCRGQRLQADISPTNIAGIHPTSSRIRRGPCTGNICSQCGRPQPENAIQLKFKCSDCQCVGVDRRSAAGTRRRGVSPQEMTLEPNASDSASNRVMTRLASRRRLNAHEGHHQPSTRANVSSSAGCVGPQGSRTGTRDATDDSTPPCNLQSRNNSDSSFLSYIGQILSSNGETSFSSRGNKTGGNDATVCGDFRHTSGQRRCVSGQLKIRAMQQSHTSNSHSNIVPGDTNNNAQGRYLNNQERSGDNDDTRGCDNQGVLTGTSRQGGNCARTRPYDVRDWSCGLSPWGNDNFDRRGPLLASVCLTTFSGPDHQRSATRLIYPMPGGGYSSSSDDESSLSSFGSELDDSASDESFSSELTPSESSLISLENEDDYVEELDSAEEASESASDSDSSDNDDSEGLAWVDLPRLDRRSDSPSQRHVILNLPRFVRLTRRQLGLEPALLSSSSEDNNDDDGNNVDDGDVGMPDYILGSGNQINIQDDDLELRPQDRYLGQANSGHDPASYRDYRDEIEPNDFEDVHRFDVELSDSSVSLRTRPQNPEEGDEQLDFRYSDRGTADFRNHSTEESRVELNLANRPMSLESSEQPVASRLRSRIATTSGNDDSKGNPNAKMTNSSSLGKPRGEKQLQRSHPCRHKINCPAHQCRQRPAPTGISRSGSGLPQSGIACRCRPPLSHKKRLGHYRQCRHQCMHGHHARHHHHNHHHVCHRRQSDKPVEGTTNSLVTSSSTMRAAPAYGPQILETPSRRCSEILSNDPRPRSSGAITRSASILKLEHQNFAKSQGSSMSDIGFREPIRTSDTSSSTVDRSSGAVAEPNATTSTAAHVTGSDGGSTSHQVRRRPPPVHLQGGHVERKRKRLSSSSSSSSSSLSTMSTLSSRYSTSWESDPCYLEGVDPPDRMTRLEMRRGLKRHLRHKPISGFEFDRAKVMEERAREEAGRAEKVNSRRQRRDALKRRRLNECERYNSLIGSFIRQLPLPRVLHAYLNFERHFS